MNHRSRKWWAIGRGFSRHSAALQTISLVESDPSVSISNSTVSVKMLVDSTTHLNGYDTTFSISGSVTLAMASGLQATTDSSVSGLMVMIDESALDPDILPQRYSNTALIKGKVWIGRLGETNSTKIPFGTSRVYTIGPRLDENSDIWIDAKNLSTTQGLTFQPGHHYYIHALPMCRVRRMQQMSNRYSTWMQVVSADTFGSVMTIPVVWR